MNILIITTQLPWPLNSGGAQAQFNMIDELRKVHNITIAFQQDRKNTLANMEQLAQIWTDVTFKPYYYKWQLRNPRFIYNKVKRGFGAFITPNSQDFQFDVALRSICIMRTGRLKNFLADVISSQKIDIVQIEFFPAIDLVFDLPATVKKVFVQHEIHYKKNERFFERLNLTASQQKAFKDSKSFEIRAMNAYDTIVTLTQKDKEILIADGVTSPIHVSPAAVNAKPLPYTPWNGKIVFVGGYGHTPNHEGIDWFIDKVLCKVKCQYKSFDIIGGGWPEKYSDDHLRIRRLGFVENLADAAQGAIMVVPILTGSGMRMKILEAAAMNIPFVTTTVGVEGLDFTDKESCLIEDDADKFAAAIDSLAISPDLHKKIAESGHAIFCEKYSKQALAKVRNEVYNA